MSANVIGLIVVIVIFSLLIIGFVSIFIIKRKLLNNNYKLKLNYNLLVINPIEYSIRSIENFVNNNDQLEPLLNYLKQYNDNFKEEVSKLKKYIQESSKYIDTYRLSTLIKTQKEIKKNINLLNKEQEKIFKFSLNTNSYTNYCSNISLEIFKLIDLFKDFFNVSKLDVYYPNITKLIELKNKINDTNLRINEQLNYINSQEFNKLLVKQFMNLKDWSILVKQVFECEKYFYVYNLLIEKFKTQLINYRTNTNEINNDLLEQSKKIINNTGIKNKVKDLISESNFDQSKIIMIDVLKTIDKLRNELTYNQKISKLFNSYNDLYNLATNEFYNTLKVNNIAKTYKKAMDTYSRNDEIKNLLEKNTKLINQINQEINNHKKTIKTNLSIEKIDEMINIFKLINDFQNDNQTLLKTIKNVNNIFIKYTYDIYEIKVKIYYLMRILKKFSKGVDLSNDEWFNKLSSISDQNEIYYQQIRKNFNLVKLNELDNFISEANNIIENITLYIRDNIYIAEITKKLKLYINRYLDQNNASQFKAIDDLIKNKQYEKAVESMLNLVNVLKQQKNDSKKSRGKNAIS